MRPRQQKWNLHILTTTECFARWFAGRMSSHPSMQIADEGKVWSKRSAYSCVAVLFIKSIASTLPAKEALQNMLCIFFCTFVVLCPDGEALLRVIVERHLFSWLVNGTLFVQLSFSLFELRTRISQGLPTLFIFVAGFAFVLKYYSDTRPRNILHNKERPT